MEWQFALPGTPAVSCRLEKSFWLGRIRLHCNGQEVSRSTEKGKPFLVRRSDNTVARVLVKGNGFDYLPKVEVDGKAIALGRPLSGVEYVIGGLPLVLIVTGGALGGASGAVGTMYNYRVLRSSASMPAKVAGLVGVTAGSFLVYVVLVALFHSLIGR